ncbi:MAG: dipeptidase, partial [Myxococcaceae bacterium]|nr:dipeptidase [Myxococcaceae bacterium]
MGASLPFYVGEPGRGRLAAHPTETMVNQLDAPTLRRAGVRIVVAALWPPLATRPRRSALDEALHQFHALHAFERRQGDFRVARSSAELRTLLAQGRIAVLPGLEGAEGIRRVEDVDVLYAAGARVLTLTHFSDNALADAADGQFGPVAALVLDGPRGGLTPLGEAVVRRMTTLGIVVDVAHCSERTVEDVLAVTVPLGVPVLASHEGSAWAAVRTLRDDLAHRIAEASGLIGVGVYRHDVLQPVPPSERWEGHQPDTCDDVVVHWLHYAGVAGHDAVVLGSDLSAPIQRPLPGGLCPEGLRNAGDLPRLFGALEARGVPREALDSMGERFLRFLERVEARADPEARAA